MRLADRLSLCWRILRARPGGLMAHAERELPSPDRSICLNSGLIERDDMQALMNRQLCELVLVFGTHGHSGMSAGYAIATLEKLLRYEPLRPLTGEPDEWVEVGPDVLQNRRCGRVFKSADRFGGQAYDIDGRVFREPSGACYTNSDSLTPVTFPYWPKTEYVDTPGAA